MMRFLTSSFQAHLLRIDLTLPLMSESFTKFKASRRKIAIFSVAYLGSVEHSKVRTYAKAMLYQCRLGILPSNYNKLIFLLG